jgi:hypothetical protein
MVQIVKFASDWVVFEHEDKCYFITCDHEFDSRELSEIAQMSFDQIKKKYKVTLDSNEDESSYCSCC